jgi:hypothetical protein
LHLLHNGTAADSSAYWQLVITTWESLLLQAADGVFGIISIILSSLQNTQFSARFLDLQGLARSSVMQTPASNCFPAAHSQ